MATITIDGKEYDTETMSDEAKAQLVSVQTTDRKIAELNSDLAMAQTARNAYAKALSDLLVKD